MNPSRLTLSLLASLLLVGCTQYAWVKPFGDPATYPADNYACKQSAMASAPPVFQAFDSGPSYYDHGRVHTRCTDYGDHEVCRTRVREPVYAPPPQMIDINEPNRADLYNACMRAQGWVLQAVEEPK